jgi:competence ComEA-like helix-hairpin-helix protein
MREDASRMRAGADEGYDPHEKPFLDHLEDLRKTLMKIIITLLITTMFAFAFNKQIFAFVLYPVMLADLGDKINFITLAPQEILMLSIKVAFFAGLIGAFPLLVFFIGEFVLPGLRQQEKRFVLPGIGVGFFLFLTGAAFAFFMACPIALKFFYEFQNERTEFLNPSLMMKGDKISASDLISAGSAADALKTSSPGADPASSPDTTIDPALKSQIIEVLRNSIAISSDSKLHILFDENTQKLILSTTPIQITPYQIGKYINFITRLVLVFGLAFQLPVVVTILVKLELLTARVMRTTRPMAWIIMLILSAVLTPPDVMTLLLLAGPLIVLYEICIWIAWFIESQREKAKQEEEDQRQKRLSELHSKSEEDLSEEEKAELHAHEIAQYKAEHAEMDDEVTHAGYDDPEDGGESRDESWHDDHHEYSEDEEHYHQEHDEYGHPIEPEPPSDEIGNCEPAGAIVNLNEATLEELQSLPGVGPALAQRLINHRPFGNFDDVLGVPGISEDKLNRMIDRLIIE